MQNQFGFIHRSLVLGSCLLALSSLSYCRCARERHVHRSNPGREVP